jgi:phosphate transport system permease protein
MSKKIISIVFAAPMLLLFIFLIANIVAEGHSGIRLSYFYEETSHAGRSGGLGPILLSTTIIVFIALLISSIVSFFAAIFLTLIISKNKTLYHVFDISLTLLSGLPSVVFGLFGNALFGQAMGLGYSLLSGALTLTCMILPFYTKILHDNFKTVPREYFLSAMALDLSMFRFTKNILIPLNLFALAAGAIFSISRALSETAALIFTSGYVDRFPHSLLDSGRTLSVHIYDLALNVPGGDQAAAKASFVFLLLALFINFLLNVVLKKTLQRGHE